MGGSSGQSRRKSHATLTTIASVKAVPYLARASTLESRSSSSTSHSAEITTPDATSRNPVRGETGDQRRQSATRATRAQIATSETTTKRTV